ncbi:hypothetical protein AAFF_G00389870 [Aldrovandia affinis]|uniref:Uncharacterized protein n=1 Tax=Aldrovandia affinis TaxID=143900 RepID=A0AAD7SEB5_9TELE|nr:hypothetical protein AAFF_G00389870 [Aldrovandia affinis]
MTPRLTRGEINHACEVRRGPKNPNLLHQSAVWRLAARFEWQLASPVVPAQPRASFSTTDNARSSLPHPSPNITSGLANMVSPGNLAINHSRTTN